VVSKTHQRFSCYSVSACIGLYFSVTIWRHAIVQNVTAYGETQEERSCFILTVNQSYKVSEKHITGSAINPAILKDKILPDTTQNILSVFNTHKSSIYEIILSVIILPKKTYKVWQNFRVCIASLETSSHFDACVTLRVRRPSLDLHYVLP